MRAEPSLTPVTTAQYSEDFPAAKQNVPRQGPTPDGRDREAGSVHEGPAPRSRQAEGGGVPTKIRKETSRLCQTINQHSCRQTCLMICLIPGPGSENAAPDRQGHRRGRRCGVPVPVSRSPCGTSRRHPPVLRQVPDDGRHPAERAVPFPSQLYYLHMEYPACGHGPAPERLAAHKNCAIDKDKRCSLFAAYLRRRVRPVFLAKGLNIDNLFEVDTR